MYRFWLPIALSLLLLSCSSEKSGEVGGQKPETAGKESILETLKAHTSSIGSSHSIEITPSDASKNSTLYLKTGGFGLADAKVEWLVDGKVFISPVPHQFNAKETNKGDNIQARVTIQGVEILSNTIQIKNAPPELTKVKIMPEVFKPGDTLYVEASGSDADGDAVTILYEWIKNGEPAGKSSKIEGTIKRGDKISIKITPFDGEAYGPEIVLEREIRNMPPMISENREYNLVGRIFASQVKAEDPDGDTLTYSIKSGPEGMTIDSSMGSIQWNVPPDFMGKTSITVSVSDGHGGEATRGFTINIP